MARSLDVVPTPSGADAAALQATAPASAATVTGATVGRPLALGDRRFAVPLRIRTAIFGTLPERLTVATTMTGGTLGVRWSSRLAFPGLRAGESLRRVDDETWRGGANPKELSWINMRVPDGSDYVEFMLYDKMPDKFGGKNHISLEVPDVAKAVAILEARPAFKIYGKELKVATGVNQKRQVNIYDPDETRVELMEAQTADGKPVATVKLPATDADMATFLKGAMKP